MPQPGMPTQEEVFETILKYFGSPKLVNKDDPEDSLSFSLNVAGFVVEVGDKTYMLTPTDVANLYDIAMSIAEAAMKQKMFGIDPDVQDPVKVNEALNRVKEQTAIFDLEQQFKN